MALHSKWVGNLLRYFNGATAIFDIDGDNGCVDVKQAGGLKIAGVAVTATAAEINAISGGGLSGAELGVLDGVTPGAAVASKAVVLSAAGKIDTIDITSPKINGVTVTASAANLNAIPTATGTGTEIDANTKSIISTQTTKVLSTSAAVQTCTITAKDANGATISAVQRLRVFLSSDAAGTTPATAANGTVAPTTGTVLKIHTAKLDWDLLTSAGGVIVLSIDNTGGTDHYAVYVNVVLPNGKLVTSLVTDVRSS